MTEFQFNSKLANLIKEKSESTNIDISIVYRDTYYSKLPGKVNRENADAVVSLHCNAYNRTTSGTEMLYYYTSTRGRALAGNLQYRVMQVLGLNDRGIKPKSSEDRGGFLLRYTAAPCVITEPFFIDNDADLKIATDNIDALADAILNGIFDYEMGIVR
jgi:N-acetylmuramoyl-L-alanine amidase